MTNKPEIAMVKKIIAGFVSLLLGRKVGLVWGEHAGMLPNGNIMLPPPTTGEAAQIAALSLLKYGADANRRYKVEPNHLAEWTPTLFAAQVGDVGIFKSLIEHDGNADLLLTQSSALERYDALWVAVDHGRHAIVDFLVKRASGSRSS